MGCGDDEAAAPDTTLSQACPDIQPSNLDTTVPAEITARGTPTVTPAAKPATELEITDLVEGDGPAVEKCDFVVAMYTGVGQISKQEFDSSWTTGEPISFPLSGVVKGWQEGLLGMKVNGRRLLVIPGSLAYGNAGRPPVIQPNETLSFVIDLVALEQP